MSKIIVVSPHPDDETLGCGGTILKHKNIGDEIYWLIITKPIKNLGFSEKFIKKRNKEINEVAKRYKMNEICKLNFPTTRLDNIALRDIISKISEVFNKIKPEIIYIPNRSDVHSDHKVTFSAVKSCIKSFRVPFIKKVLMYETVSETEFAPPLQGNSFQPNSFCDISNYIEEKLNIFEIYESEIEKHPFPRSRKNINALATFRGAMINVEYAEAFMILKEIF